MKPIPFALPVIRRAERRAVQRVMRSKWLTSGEVCAQFEREFAEACDARHAVAVNSATAGLHIALCAAGFGKDDILCVSPYTFTASATVALHLGMRVEFVDIERQGYNIDCDRLEKKVRALCARKSQGRRIAIMAVHIGGLVCDMKRILDIARRYHCYVIEDAAHCQPLIGEGRSVMGRGDCVVFSFYATKPITSAEGGMVVTDNDSCANTMRLLRNHGMSKSAWRRADGAPQGTSVPASARASATVSTEAFWAYDIRAHGFKYNLPDILASLGRVQLQRAQKHWQQRSAIARCYMKHLRNIPWIALPHARIPAHSPTHSWHLFLCQLRASMLTINRDAFVSLMYRAGVHCSVHYIPLHITDAYRHDFGYREDDFAHAVERYRNEISLPLHPRMTPRICAYIARTIRDIGERHIR